MRIAKRATALLLCLVLAAGLLTVAAFADNESFDISYTLDKESYAVGDTVTVTVTLNRKDSSEDYLLYNFQDYVVYDPNLLSYQGGQAASAIFTLSAGVDGKGAVYSANRKFISLRYQYTSVSGTPDARSATLAVATLRFKVLGNCSTAISHGSARETQVWTSHAGTAGETVTGTGVTVIGGTPEQYTLSFDVGAGAEGSVDSITAYAGVLAPIPSGDGLTKSGKTFIGWYDGAKLYYPGDRYYVKGDASFKAC